GSLFLYAEFMGYAAWPLYS
ncbi:hypothetical protein EVA_10394, partial [gut metagenome]